MANVPGTRCNSGSTGRSRGIGSTCRWRPIHKHFLSVCGGFSKIGESFFNLVGCDDLSSIQALRSPNSGIDADPESCVGVGFFRVAVHCLWHHGDCCPDYRAHRALRHQRGEKHRNPGDCLGDFHGAGLYSAEHRWRQRDVTWTSASQHACGCIWRRSSIWNGCTEGAGNLCTSLHRRRRVAALGRAAFGVLRGQP